MSEPHATLVAAKRHINTPEKWAKGPKVEYGKRYCTLGALKRVGSGEYVWPAVDELCFVGGFKTTRDVMAFNDHPSTTHAMVMALYNKAIAQSRTASRARKWRTAWAERAWKPKT